MRIQNSKSLGKFVFVVFLLVGTSTNVLASSYVEFLSQLEKEFNNRNYAYVSDVIDLDAVLDKSFKQVEVSDSFRRQFSDGFNERGKKDIGKVLLRNTPKDAKIKLIRTNMRQNFAEGIFRFDYGENGFGYIRFYLRESKNKKIKITDWYDYARGQTYTDSITTIVRSIAPTPGILGKLKDIGSGKKKEEKHLLKYSKLVSSKDFKGLRKMFDTADESFKQNWVFMSGLLSAANMSGDEKFYKDVLTSISKYFGHDERAGYLLIDHYFYREEYAKVLPILDGLLKAFDNNDAGILLLKSNTLTELGKNEQAKNIAKQCIQVEPDFEDCYWNLVTISVLEKNFQSTVKNLSLLETEFGYQFDHGSFEGEDFYREFVNSLSYSQWIK